MNTQERDFKGIWIPKEIWLNENLSMTEKILLVEIDSLDNEDGCFASNEYFSEFLGCGMSTITRGISKLKDLGYIQQVSFDGRSRVLRSSLVKMIRQNNQNDLHNNTINISLDDKSSIDLDPTKDKDEPKAIIKKEADFDWDKLLETINTKTGRGFKVINNKVKSKYKARLKEGYTKRDIATAITNACLTDYHKGNNYQYCTPEFFSRSDTIDKYASVVQTKNNQPTKPKLRLN